MVRIRNVGNGPVVVGEKYLYPGESRLVNSDQAAASLAQHPDRLAAQSTKEQAFAEGEDPRPHADGVTVEGGHEATPRQDNLRAIRGIGARTAEALAFLGVETFQALVNADADELDLALDGSSVAQVERWQEQAQQLLNRLDG